MSYIYIYTLYIINSNYYNMSGPPACNKHDSFIHQRAMPTTSILYMETLTTENDSNGRKYDRTFQIKDAFRECGVGDNYWGVTHDHQTYYSDQ